MAEAGGSAAEHRTNLLAALVLAGDYAEAAAYAEGLPEEVSLVSLFFAWPVPMLSIDYAEAAAYAEGLPEEVGLVSLFLPFLSRRHSWLFPSFYRPRAC
jgi:hypothetical protein